MNRQRRFKCARDDLRAALGRIVALAAPDHVPLFYLLVTSNNINFFRQVKVFKGRSQGTGQRGTLHRKNPVLHRLGYHLHQKPVRVFDGIPQRQISLERIGLFHQRIVAGVILRPQRKCHIGSGLFPLIIFQRELYSVGVQRGVDIFQRGAKLYFKRSYRRNSAGSDRDQL